MPFLSEYLREQGMSSKRQTNSTAREDATESTCSLSERSLDSSFRGGGRCSFRPTSRFTEQENALLMQLSSDLNHQSSQMDTNRMFFKNHQSQMMDMNMSMSMMSLLVEEESTCATDVRDFKKRQASRHQMESEVLILEEEEEDTQHGEKGVSSLDTSSAPQEADHDRPSFAARRLAEQLCSQYSTTTGDGLSIISAKRQSTDIIAAMQDVVDIDDPSSDTVQIDETSVLLLTLEGVNMAPTKDSCMFSSLLDADLYDAFYCVETPVENRYGGVERFAIVHQSETIEDTTSPRWKPASIPLDKLCQGDLDKWIRIDILDDNDDGGHESIEHCDTTVRHLLKKSAASKGGNTLRTRSKSGACGKLVVVDARIVSREQ